MRAIGRARARGEQGCDTAAPCARWLRSGHRRPYPLPRTFFLDSRCPTLLHHIRDALPAPARSADASYTSAETGVKIRADMPVRLKVIGATVLQSALCAIGSIKDDFLGLLV